MAITLWDYQEEALNSVTKDFQAGTCRQLIVLPTASGKRMHSLKFKQFSHVAQGKKGYMETKFYLEGHGLPTDNLTRHDAFVMIQKIKQGERFTQGQRV